MKASVRSGRQHFEREAVHSTTSPLEVANIYRLLKGLFLTLFVLHSSSWSRVNSLHYEEHSRVRDPPGVVGTGGGGLLITALQRTTERSVSLGCSSAEV